jgi:hypothetical protein
MRKHHLLAHVLPGLGLLALANLVPQTFVGAAEAQAPKLAPGPARVWFLRSVGSLNGNVWAAEPEIYANGAPVGDIPVGSKFYRDFRPGTYRFTVQSYGLPTGAADTVYLALGTYLAPGTQTYLEIEWLASWQEGYPEAGYSFAPNTFGILTMSPQLAQAYLPTLAYHP